MNALERALDGLILFETRKFADDRGFFEEFFNQKTSGLNERFVQVNHSRSVPGVVRGLHYQNTPPQGKFVGVIRGRIWDVAVDIRDNSPTRGQHFGRELSETNGRLLWIPAGFAHGFCCLGDEPADVIYLVDNVYNPAGEAGIRWDDPTLRIPWPLDRPAVVSAKDQAQPGWA